MFFLIRRILRPLTKSTLQDEYRYYRNALKKGDDFIGDGDDVQSEAKVLYVVDGDTLIVAQGWSEVTVRLDSIDCPEDGQDWGSTALYGLIKLVGGRRVRLETYGLDAYGRTLATIYVRGTGVDEWINVNERMVMLGHAWVMRGFWHHLSRDRQDTLNRMERWARAKKVGLWRVENPIPPWEWRQRREE